MCIQSYPQSYIGEQRLYEGPTAVNVDIFAQYIFSPILDMALCVWKFDVSEKINQNSTKRIKGYLREILVARKCLLRLDARKFRCTKISMFTVCLATNNL